MLHTTPHQKGGVESFLELANSSYHVPGVTQNSHYTHCTVPFGKLSEVKDKTDRQTLDLRNRQCPNCPWFRFSCTHTHIFSTFPPPDGSGFAGQIDMTVRYLRTRWEACDTIHHHQDHHHHHHHRNSIAKRTERNVWVCRLPACNGVVRGARYGENSTGNDGADKQDEQTG